MRAIVTRSLVTKEVKPPVGWRETYDMITELRKERDAPVDSQGCERLGSGDYPEHEKQFHVLVSLMLSSQTKDQTTAEAVGNLKQHGLTVGNVLAMPDKFLNSLICKVGFHNNKTRYLKQACQILRDKHGDRVPNTLPELLALPGVGPKMAYLCLNCAFGLNSGIGVDTHVHRICNQLGWVKTKNAEQTRLKMEEWLPRELWTEINWLFVGFEQQTDQMRLIRKALQSRNPPFAISLLKRVGVKIDARNKDSAGCSETALHWAVRVGDIPSIQLLLNHGSSKYTKDSTGRTPLDIALESSELRSAFEAVRGIKADRGIKRKKEEDVCEPAGAAVSGHIEVKVEVKVKEEACEEGIPPRLSDLAAVVPTTRSKRRRY